MDPISSLASIAGVIGATIKSVEYLNDVKDASKERAECERELISSLALLFELKHYLVEPDSAKIRQGAVRILSVKYGPFAQCETILKDLHTKLTKDHKFYATVKWRFTKQSIGDLRKRLEGVKSTIQLAVQTDQLKLSRSIDRQTQNINP